MNKRIAASISAYVPWKNIWVNKNSTILVGTIDELKTNLLGYWTKELAN